jgi:hypothetical protein
VRLDTEAGPSEDVVDPLLEPTGMDPDPVSGATTSGGDAKKVVMGSRRLNKELAANEDVVDEKLLVVLGSEAAATALGTIWTAPSSVEGRDGLVKIEADAVTEGAGADIVVSSNARKKVARVGMNGLFIADSLETSGKQPRWQLSVGCDG